MTEKDVINDLKSRVKPYVTIEMTQSYFSNVLIRYDVGLLKPKTIVKFLENFGYKQVDGEWMNSEKLKDVEYKPQKANY
jgi:hypothetical protein